MSEENNNKFKQRMNEMAIENHRTAAWANMEKMKDICRVPIPSIYDVKAAKEYVDTNQK